MKQTKNPTKDIETLFDKDEVLFSTTDLKGNICSCNHTFSKISQYSFDEIVGKSYDSAFHPDMPEVISKLILEYLKNQKISVFYLKEKAQDNSYYWVLAVITPIFDKNNNVYRYLYIRIKPESKYFKYIQSIYEETRSLEKKYGVEEGYKFFIKKINELGFKDYDEFVKKIFEEEIKLKKELLDKHFTFENIDKDAKNIYKAFLLFSEIKDIYVLFHSYLKAFSDVSNLIKKEAKDIFNLSDDIRLISLNSSVESYKLGSNGNSFFVLSTEMRKNAELSAKIMKQMEGIISTILSEIKDVIFFIGITKLGIHMMSSFLKEILNDEINISRLNTIAEDIKDNMNFIEFYINRLCDISLSLDKRFKEILGLLHKVNNLIKRLHFLYLTGMVESAHQIETKFSLIFSQVDTLVQKSKSTINNLCSNMNKIAYQNREIKLKIGDILDLVEEAKKELELEYI